ncbi:ATP-dependent RNA helicase RhlE [Arcticibacter pallidicorallinus]|uniref:ATP-dependent RNA helicase RhlE n=1 Tax=Arcticibacter pallidicorallinus TaxID=1259464 RepID=A0A2T0U386_9SPHI|nr:DEAD/DEAH box helicase [Arcticibacter pallidicorallinus]PRY52371.1 ATP-dependent RNA helicase RhlE [Arcticibacter pallidicorallinus]
MWLEKIKLSKQLVRSVTEAGYLVPKEIQLRTMSRIIGGQDIIAVGPEGCGKTTTYILGVLMRLKQTPEIAPRALILVPDKERVEAVVEQINLLNKNKSLRIVSLTPGSGMEAELDELADGADIIVATPDRARAIYLKLALDLNKIQMFVVDDAELIVKQGLQLPVNELANSIIKCQRLVFAEVMHSRIEQMIEPFMRDPSFVEVEEEVEPVAEIYPQELYNVPNFRTKLNLLNVLLRDSELPKTVVFVNTRLTAEKVYNSLFSKVKSKSAILNPVFFESRGVGSIDDFYDSEELETLIVANELTAPVNLRGIDRIIHLEPPVEKETFISRVIKDQDEEIDAVSVVFSTDIELADIKKVEQALGYKFPIVSLPEGVVVDAESKPKAKAKRKTEEEPARGEAFHEKKEKNSKDYNIGAGKKAKLDRKRKHS